MNAKPPESSISSPPGKTGAVGSLAYTRAGLVTVIFWLLLGAFAWALKMRVGQPATQLLLSDIGAPDNFSSVLIISIPAAMAMFVLPLLGYFSDRYRSPSGRRIPFLASAIPIVAISMAGLAASPWLGGKLTHAFSSLLPDEYSGKLLCIGVFWTLFAFADIMGNLILGALVNDVIPQRIMGRFFGAFRAVGLLAGVIFNYFVFDLTESAYVPIFLGTAAFTVVVFGLMCLKVREGSYPAPPPDPKGWEEVGRDAKVYLKDCFGSSFYALLCIAWALSTTAWTPVNLYSVLFSTGLITPTHYGNLVTLTYALSFVVAYPLGILADRFHPLRLGIVTLALYALGALWGGLYATTPLRFDIAFVLHGVLSGLYLSGTASLLQRMFPRLKFAQYAAAAGATVCLANILIGPLAGFILNATQHDYRSIFLMSAAQAGLGLVLTIFLYRAYLARGGDKQYVPPGEEPLPA